MQQTFLRLGFIWLAVAAMCVFAFCFRTTKLEERVMHGDEANQAVRAGILLEGGGYQYDPNDHHGPTMYYAAIPFCKATSKTFADTTEWNYRIVPVVFSILTLILMVGLYSPDRKAVFTHPVGIVTAIALTALSPAMNYYSRFFIQESMFVTFLTGMLVCAVQYVRAGGRWGDGVSPSRMSVCAGGFGVFLGLAVATKETVVLSVAAAAIAAFCVCGYRRLLNAWNTRDFLIMVGATLLVMVLFFSSFFTYPKGLYALFVETIPAYLNRAGVDDHRNPWDFYLKLLFWHRYGPPVWSQAGLKGVLWVGSSWYEKGRIWSEAGVLILPVLLAIVMAFVPRRFLSTELTGLTGLAVRTLKTGSNPANPVNPVRKTDDEMGWVKFIVVYTLVLTALYSVIPYKTPWCMLSFLHGYILLAGVGVGLVWEWQMRLPWKWRGGGIAVLVVLLAYGGVYQKAQSERACYKLAADTRNPYVYAHTRADALELVSVVEDAAQKRDGFDTRIAVAAPVSDYWPLPWYLRKYRQIGYYTNVTEISGLSPAILIIEPAQRDAADKIFGEGKEMADFGYNIRPGVLLKVLLP